MKRAAVVVLGVIAIVCLLAQYRVRSEGLGAKLSSLVVGGFETRGYWPWFVSLEISRPDGIHVCGGVLIRKDVVLTAAHCIQQVKSIICRIGNDNVSSNEFVRANSWEVHPNYIPFNNTTQTRVTDDIALVFLGQEINKTPIRMSNYYPTKTVRGDTIRSPIYTLGYGRTGFGNTYPLSDTLQTFLTNQWVIKTDGKGAYIATTLNKAHAGSGDSGGPCIFFEGNTTDYKSARLVGIVSGGNVSAGKGETKFAAVPYHYKWIMGRLATRPLYCRWSPSNSARVPGYRYCNYEK